MTSPRVSVVNLGCRVNRVESDRMTAELALAGYPLVDEDAADLVVINTCAVTGEAEAKTRKAVRHALSLPRSPLVLVTGCVVNLHPEELTALSDRVVAEPSKADVATRVRGLLGVPAAHAGHGFHLDLGELLGRSRVGIKIQDGCNHRCTYCIVWKARGPERSVEPEEVLAQVREAGASKIPEVVLTGVNLGAYAGRSGCGAVLDIAGLLDAILEKTDIPHVRLSSIEPMDASLRLIERMAQSPERVAPFLHLPIQSGCTPTLHRMGRPYSAEDLKRLVADIRGIMPSIALSCDLIVGFPGETDEEFEQTREFCEQVGFARMHVFRYSKRPGTPAAAAPDQVAPEVMAERSAIMRELADRMALDDARARVGSVERCVVEYLGRGTLGSFHRVVIDDAPELPAGELVDVLLTGVDERGVLHGSLADRS